MERKSEHPFIVFEGIDGTGKSTVSALVAEKIGATRVATPMEPYASIRPKFSEETWNPLDSFKFYLEAVKYASGQIEQMCQDGAVVCDRFIASTYAYHTGMGLSPETAKAMIEEADLLQPTIGIQLEAIDEVIERRLAHRGSKPLKKEWLEKIRKSYELFNYTIVDTTNLTPEEVANNIVDILSDREVIKR